MARDLFKERLEEEVRRGKAKVIKLSRKKSDEINTKANKDIEEACRPVNLAYARSGRFDDILLY